MSSKRVVSADTSTDGVGIELSSVKGISLMDYSLFSNFTYRITFPVRRVKFYVRAET